VKGMAHLSSFYRNMVKKRKRTSCKVIIVINISIEPPKKRRKRKGVRTDVIECTIDSVTIDVPDVQTYFKFLESSDAGGIVDEVIASIEQLDFTSSCCLVKTSLNSSYMV
jgi:hypothetical protein